MLLPHYAQEHFREISLIHVQRASSHNAFLFSLKFVMSLKSMFCLDYTVSDGGVYFCIKCLILLPLSQPNLPFGINKAFLSLFILLKVTLKDQF